MPMESMILGAFLTLLLGAVTALMSKHFNSQAVDIAKICTDLETHAREETKYLKEQHDKVNNKIEKIHTSVEDSAAIMVKVQYKINEDMLNIHKAIVDIALNQIDNKK